MTHVGLDAPIVTVTVWPSSAADESSHVKRTLSPRTRYAPAVTYVPETELSTVSTADAIVGGVSTAKVAPAGLTNVAAAVTNSNFTLVHPAVTGLYPVKTTLVPLLVVVTTPAASSAGVARTDRRVSVAPLFSTTTMSRSVSFHGHGLVPYTARSSVNVRSAAMSERTKYVFGPLPEVLYAPEPGSVESTPLIAVGTGATTMLNGTVVSAVRSSAFVKDTLSDAATPAETDPSPPTPVNVSTPVPGSTDAVCVPPPTVRVALDAIKAVCGAITIVVVPCGTTEGESSYTGHATFSTKTAATSSATGVACETTRTGGSGTSVKRTRTSPNSTSAFGVARTVLANEHAEPAK